MPRRFLTVVLVFIVAVSVLAAGLAAWLLYTPGGLKWAAAQAARWSKGALALEYEGGTLRDGTRFGRIRYTSPTLSVEANAVRVRVSPWSLIRLAPRVNELSAAFVRVHLPADADAPARKPEVPALPIALEIDAARITRLSIERGAETTTVENIFLRYAADSAAHRVRDLKLRTGDVDLSADATVGTGAPYPVEARALLNRAAPAPSLSARLRAQGSLERLALEIDAQSAGARIDVAASLDPGAELPVAALRAAVSGLDLRALDSRLPASALAAELAVSRRDKALAGTVRLTNSTPGPYDAGRLPVSAARATIRTDLAQMDVDDLLIDLGAGRLTGSARLGPDAATLRIAADNIDLAALHGRLQRTRLDGKAQAVLERERQALTADLTQDAMRLRLRLERSGVTVALREAILSARGGEARARGNIVLEGEQPFSAAVEFKRFDPSAWGDFPQGSVNGTLNARGNAEAPSARFELAIRDSRLLGAPLSGAGRGSVAAKRFSIAELVLQLGRNRAQVSGAIGRPNDTLRVRVDAQQITMLHPQWAGRVQADAKISGALDSPRADFEVRADAVRAPELKIARATARGVLALDPGTPLRLDARLTGLEAAGRLIEQMTLEFSGPQNAHTAAVSASGPGFNAVARARGSWQQARRSWSGTLLEFANRGALDAALETPVAITAAPQRIEVGRFTLRLLDGRIEAAESRYDAGKISTRGEFARLPVLALARALQVAPRVGGTLRLSGAWSLVRDNGALNGLLTARREAGDITLGPDGALPINLRTLAAELRVGADRLDFQATLASALANAETAGTVGVIAVDRRPAIGPASPLRFSARIALAELSAIAPLIDANVLAGGALDATLSGSGMLGRPSVTGEVRGERLAFTLPPQGIDLKSGSLRATLQERAIRIDSFAIRGGEGTFTARGRLAMNGADAALDWRAERLLLLGRPDRRLVVSGKGRAAMTGGKLALAGGVRAEEGYFEIGPDALPEPGADVVIAGRTPRGKADRGFERMLIDLAVSLGDNLRVRGRGLDTRLTGEITVATGATGNLGAKGALRTVRGNYTALGQRLEIERGELIFTGPLDNPGLDILALRKRQAVEAGVAVTGTLESPLARIVSEPPVPESEAISWLVLGHGTGDASRGDLAMLPLAASSLLGKGDSPTVAQRLGLDTLGLRGAGTEGQFLAAGKRIADRLYIGFEQSLGAAASILKLEFDLTQRVLLRAQTGEANSVGVFYRYTFD